MTDETTQVISISVTPRALAVIDRAARVRGLSRSRFLTLAGLLAADEILGDDEPEPHPEETALHMATSRPKRLGGVREAHGTRSTSLPPGLRHQPA